ncbi:MAG: flagellar hook-length control protein FliK [Bacillota bacterium]
MQTHNMLPALLNILSGRTVQNRMDKATSRQDTGEVKRQAAGGAGEAAAAAGAGKVGEGEMKAPPSPSAGHALPDVLPLPYKSPLFSESRFYIKNDSESRATSGTDTPASLFMRLKTDNLGVIWIHMAARSKSLSISFYAEEDSYTGIIREDLPHLVESLRKLGYPDVRAAGITRPGITGCADIVPGLTAPANYLLDLEV